MELLRNIVTIALLASPLPGLTAMDIIEGAQELMRGATSYGVYKMTVVRPGKPDRVIKMRFWDDHDAKRSLIVIDHPAKERGKVFLKRDNNLYMYIPEPVDTRVRIPPSMMLQGWMGSDFTNDDLVKESSLSEDYDASIVSEAARGGGKTAYTLRLVPHQDAPVVWGRVDVDVVMPGHIPVQYRFYNERDELVRSLNFYDVKVIAGRTMPTRMEVIPAKAGGEKTVMYFEELSFNVKIDPARFSESNIKLWSDE